MISYATYKLVHYLGLFLIFTGLGGVFFAFLNGSSFKGKAKAIVFSTHGLGMFFALVGGFGMLARIGITGGLPNWIYIKLLVWVFLGLAIAIAKRKPSIVSLLLILLIGLIAPWAAMNKPF